MTTKVKNTVSLQTSQGDTIVAKGKLVFINSSEEAKNGNIVRDKNHGGKLWIYKKAPCPIPYWGGNVDSYFLIKPIIISETEEIEINDRYIIKNTVLYRNPDWQLATSGLKENELELRGSYPCKKVLVMPDQFSPKHLQAIADGKLKDGDEVYVECFKHSYDSLKQPFVDIGVYAERNNIHTSVKQSHQNYAILHRTTPVNKMYTQEEVDRLLDQQTARTTAQIIKEHMRRAWNAMDRFHQDTHGKFAKRPNFSEWIKDNL